MELTEIPPAEPLSEVVLTIPEIAFVAGVKVGTVERWKAHSPNRARILLEPDQYIGDTPVWRWKRVIAWLEATGRDQDESLQSLLRARKAGAFRRRRS